MPYISCASAIDPIDNSVEVMSKLIDFAKISLDVLIRSPGIVSQTVEMASLFEQIIHVSHEVAVFSGLLVMILKFLPKIFTDFFDIVSEANDVVLASGLGIPG